MSLEYTAPVVLSGADIDRLLATLPNTVYMKLPPTGTSHLSLRLATARPPPGWPEDIGIRFGEDNIYVAIHSASAIESAKFIRYLTLCVRALGHTCSFEEE